MSYPERCRVCDSALVNHMIATNLIDGAMPSIDVLGSHVGECVEDGADERAIDCCTKQQFTGRLQETNRRAHAHVLYLDDYMRYPFQDRC